MSADNGLRPLFRRHLSNFYWTSIETGGTSLGIADSNYISKTQPGREGWVEYKAANHWEVDMRPEQIGFALQRSRCGGRIWIAVRRAGALKNSDPYDELWLFPGSLVIQAKEGGLRHPSVLRASWHWCDGPSNWDWSTIALALNL